MKIDVVNEDGKTISERDLIPESDSDSEELLDERTEELLRQLDVPSTCMPIAEMSCMPRTFAIEYRGEPYVLDPSDLEDVEYFITSVLDHFFGFDSSEKDRAEFNQVMKKLLQAIPDNLFNDEENKLFKLLVSLPGDEVIKAICSRVAYWTQERFELLMFCAESVWNIPRDFLAKHASESMFRQVVYNLETTYGDCMESSWAYSQVKTFLDSCM